MAPKSAPMLHCVKCKGATPSYQLRRGASARGVHSVCGRCKGRKHNFVGAGFFSNLFSGNVGGAFDDLGNGANGIAHHAISEAGAAAPMFMGGKVGRKPKKGKGMLDFLGLGVGPKRGGRKGSVNTKKRSPKKGKGMEGNGFLDFLGI